MRPGSTFVPRRTMRLVPGEDDREIDVIAIAHALGEHAENVTGIQSRFGGKAYDITWNEDTDAISAASRAFNFNRQYFDLRLLGRKSIDVSVFVTCEFPSQYLIALLQRYGDFDGTKIRRLTLKEPGLEHIENGVRVVTFTQLTDHIPNTVVYRGVPLGFRYTGQPKLCFKCASPDHQVRDCPRRNPPPENPQDINDTNGNENENDKEPTNTQKDTDTELEMETTPPEPTTKLQSDSEPCLK